MLTWDDRELMNKQAIEELMGSLAEWSFGCSPIFTLLSLLDFSEQDPYYTVGDTDSLASVLQLFSAQSDLHRLTVFKSDAEEEKVFDIIYC